MIIEQMNKLKVLVVDDAKFIRERVTSMVRDAFPQSAVYACENGRDAIKAMSQEQFSIILCDWEMPQMSGLEVLQWTRAQDNYKQVPFLMVTSRGEDLVNITHLTGDRQLKLLYQLPPDLTCRRLRGQKI